MSETLFDLDVREGDEHAVHVLLPDMSYACGGSILTKRGHFTVGAHRWDEVTCPDCRVHGQDVLLEESRAMQGRQADMS